MSDPTPPNSPDPDQSASDIAAEALRQAQQAVNELNKAPAPIASSPSQDDEVTAALAAAQRAIAEAQAASSGPELNPEPSYTIPTAASSPGPAPMGSAAPNTQPFPLQSFGAASPSAAKPEGIDLLSDVNLNVKIELGRTRMLVEDVLRLGEGSVVELDKLAGDPVDVYVNDRHVARGEVLVLNDNFCVRINEIVAAVGENGPAQSGRARR